MAKQKNAYTLVNIEKHPKKYGFIFYLRNNQFGSVDAIYVDDILFGLSHASVLIGGIGVEQKDWGWLPVKVKK